MSLFSLNWFKSQNQKELEKLRVEEQKLKNEILKLDKEEMMSPDSIPIQEDYYKVYRKIKLVNNVLTVILKDGSLISRPDSDINDFLNIKNSNSENEILTYMVGKAPVYNEFQEKDTIRQRKEENEAKAHDSLSILAGKPDFKVENGSVYMNGIDRSLPALLVAKFGSLYSNYRGLNIEQTDEYQSLKKFWLKCCLNPNARSAEDLYEFLENHHFKIDRHGNFYAYRRVVSRNNKNKKLIEFVSNTYNKVKAVWKKSPKNYGIFYNTTNSEYRLKLLEEGPTLLENFTGELEELYLDLPNMQEKNYTSAHTGREDYRVGDIISMPRNEGDDDNTVNCSKGFHAASKMYDYSGFGDTPILMIINPMDVLSVPVGEVGKLRTCRWFFAMTLPEDEEYILDDDDFDVSELGDVFEEKSKIDETYVKTSFAEEIKRHTFTTPSISSIQVNKILKTLDEMKAVLSNRVRIL